MKRLWNYSLPLILAGCLPLLAAGQSRRPDAAPVFLGALHEAGGEGQVTIRLVSVPGGVAVTGGGSGNGALNLGTVSYFSSAHSHRASKTTGNSITRTSEFGIELEARAPAATGAAMISARLANPSPNCRYGIDGIRLTTAPQVISPRTRYGVITEHRLDIEVPQTAPPGMKRASIIWTVTPEE